MAVAAKNIVESFREVVQDLLVPELKAVRVSVDSMKVEMQLRDEKVHTELRLRDERMQESIRGLSQKLDFPIDIRERLAALEARLPGQWA